MFHPVTENDKTFYLSKLSSRRKWLFPVLFLLVAGALCSLPFLYFDVSVKAIGIVRPSMERTEIKPIQSGIIDTIFFTEGQTVLKDSLLLRLRDNNTLPKVILNNYELAQRQQYIHDLSLLTTNPYITGRGIESLQSPVYKQQINRFIYQKAEQEASLKKVTKELYMDSVLSVDKVIAPKEMFDKIVENEKLQAAYRAFKNEQLSVWQQDLARYHLELSQLEAQRIQLGEEKKMFEVRSPVTGVVQGINTKYAGGFLQAGESLCTISPETDLIAECYVGTSDVGMLKPGKEARFQVDAFDYNYFGILTGKIISIDNDFTVVENKPVFKVRCSFDTTQLHLKNGFSGSLKKGLTFQVRFLVTRRSAWQLLFDKMDDWLNPAAP